MKPSLPARSFRKWLLLPLALSVAGCTSFMFPNNTQDLAEVVVAEDEPDDDAGVVLVGDMAGPWGMKPVKVEGIALVTNLDNTGSDPAPSTHREMLMGEMQANGARSPNGVLASKRTSLVTVRAFMPPGVRKGDRFDVELSVPPRSETVSLMDGWLMKTRLKEMAVMGGELHTGHDVALCQGHVLVDAVLEGGDDPIHLRKGRVLGGGIALKSRPLGLAMRTGHKSVRNSTLVAGSVNRRFHTFDQGNTKTGVAKPLRDNYIELTVYPRYKNNLWRYVRVISCISVKETADQRVERLELLRRQLLHPATASRAALKLEAIGSEGAPALKEALRSDNDEIRFYAAEALAYLDDSAAAPVLADLARREPAFRWHALTALSAMDDLTAYDQLVELLHVDSAETRYGAFRALKARSSQDPLVTGEDLDGHFTYHEITSEGVPLVHVTRSRDSEIVVFGRNVQLRRPAVLFTDTHLTLKTASDGQLRISRFAPRQTDRQVMCSHRLGDVVRGLVSVGASYADVVAVLQQAKDQEMLDARVIVDAVPRPGRKYQREDTPAEEGQPSSGFEVASPLPGLFAFEQPNSPEEYTPPPEAKDEDLSEDDLEPTQPWWAFFGRMKR